MGAGRLFQVVVLSPQVLEVEKICGSVPDPLVTRAHLGADDLPRPGDREPEVGLLGQIRPLLLANGEAGGPELTVQTPQLATLRDAVEEVCTSLVEQLAADAEGGTKAICVAVRGAVDDDEARRAARTVVLSPLVKCAVHGADPNWGRIVAALGRSGASFSLDRSRVAIGGIEVFAGGQPLPVNLDAIRAAFTRPRIEIDIELGGGEGRARAWGCDLSADYVRINAEYMT